MQGLTTDPVPVAGDPVVAVFRPSAVSVFREPPGGSPRNTIAATVTDLEPLRRPGAGPRRASLAADVTDRSRPPSSTSPPGLRVVFSIKATEVSIYRT